MKHLYKNFVIIAVLISSMSYAQQQPNFLFFEQNMSIVNPAFSGSQGAFVALNYSSAWAGVADAPRATSLVYNTDISRNAAWGFSYMTNRVYVENQGMVGVDYSYRLQLSEDSFLHLGLKGGGLYNTLDLDKLNRITTESNPALSGITNYFNPLLGVGAFLKTKDLFFGISVPNILNSKHFKEVNGIETTATDRPHLYLTSGASIVINDNITFEPGMMYRVVSGAPNVITAIGRLTFNELVSLGTGVSNNHYIAAQVLFKGVKDLEIGYGYEIGQRHAQALKANTHELVIKYNLSKLSVD